MAPSRQRNQPDCCAKKRIAFLTKGHFSSANSHIEQILAKEFPEYQLERIDMADLLRDHKLLRLRNTWLTLRTFPREILLRKRSFRECFYLTPFLFKAVREMMPGYVSPKTHAFSLQTQSLLDFSVPGVPHFIYTDHTHLTNLNYAAFDPSQLLPRWWIDLERSIYTNAQRIFVMTRQVERTLVEDYGQPPSKVACIHAGSNVPVSAPGERQQRILFVGLNWSRKGGPQLLAAFLQIAGKFPASKLVVVGCKPPIHHPQVEILGKIPLEAVRQQYQKAQIFAFPTRIEPAGFVAIEAFWQKLPIVATPVGVMPELVSHGENGLLVAPDDIQGLADALADLLADPEKCRRFGENGYRVASKSYSWEAVGKALRKNILESLSMGAPAAF
jgi:glycosyltransferase involved in cell wall biosynthesis